MSLVVARTVLVRLPEVAKGDRAIGCGDDVREANVFRALGEHVSATDAALGLDESRAFQDEENLFEVGLGETSSGGNVTHGSGARVVAVEGK